MARRFLLPLLALTLLAAEAAHAQTAPDLTSSTGYVKARKAARMPSKREQKATAVAAARVQAAATAASQPTAAANPTSWSGWSNEPLPFTPTTATHRATDANLSVAPGMPINQLGHGVSTDYHGRPIAPTVASTTLPNVR
ncbi:MAG: hypothetical protein ACRYFK_01900 [Janthinobacterium lividum]